MVSCKRRYTKINVCLTHRPSFVTLIYLLSSCVRENIRRDQIQSYIRLLTVPVLLLTHQTS